ncbi:hypothetical protein H1R20_g10814, partial [Candolleomyces eurysporus]
MLKVLRRVRSFLPSRGGRGRFGEFPTEILQEIFIHCCGDEYIDFFLHCKPVKDSEMSPAAGPRGSNEDVEEYSRCSTAYTLKAVCKNWKAIVEATPQLWQRLYFEFDPMVNPSVISPQESLLEPNPRWIRAASKHYSNMLKRIFLPRSAGISLHLILAGLTLDVNPAHWNVHRRKAISPLLRVLRGEKHRWSDLAFSGIPFGSVFTRSTRPSKSQLPPLLSKLTLFGMRESIGLPGLSKLKWNHITTLVLSNLYSPESDGAGAGEVLSILRAASSSLAHLHWQGGIGSRVTSNPSITIRLENLLTLTMEDSDLQFSTVIIPMISTPKLESLRLLAGAPAVESRTRTGRRAKGAASALEKLLQGAPHIQEVFVVQAHSISWGEGVIKDAAFSAPENYKRDFRYSYYTGTRAQFRDDLQQHPRLSKIPTDVPLQKLPLDVMTQRLTSSVDKGRNAPPLIVPTSPADGWMDRTMHCYDERRLSRLFHWIDYMVHQQSVKKASKPHSYSADEDNGWAWSGFKPAALPLLIHFMEIIRSSNFPSPNCRFTTVVISFRSVISLLERRGMM